MLPITFSFVPIVAVGAAHQLKGALYRLNPSRTNPANDWAGGESILQESALTSPLTPIDLWADRYELTTVTFVRGKEELVMNDAVIGLSRKKNIVSTPMVGRDGTVKEYVNQDDYQIKIAVGVQAKRDGVLVDEYPTEGIEELRRFFDVAEAIEVRSKFLAVFEIDQIVITDFSLTQATESNYQPITLSAVADEEYNVVSTEY